MKAKMRRILAFMLAIVMTLTLAVPTQTYAAEADGATVDGGVKTEDSDVSTEDGIAALSDENGSSWSFDESADYAMVVDGDKAANVLSVGWTDALKFDASYDSVRNEVSAKTAVFKIKVADTQPTDLEANQLKIQIIYREENTDYPLRVEGQNFPWIDPNKRVEENETNSWFIINKTGDFEGKLFGINNNQKRYIGKDGNKTALYENEADAVTIKFIPVSGVMKFGPGEFSLKHKASDKLVKTYQNEGDILTVDGNEEDAGTVFSAPVFGECKDHNNGTTPISTISLVSKDYGKGIKSVHYVDGQGAVADFVKVNNSINGDGWESIRIIPNGDGTISLKDSFYDEYITVDNQKRLAGRSGLTKETLTDNEKFVICTHTAPKAVENLAINPSTKTQTTLDLLWTNPRCLYSEIELYQKKADDLNWSLLAVLTEEETYTVTDLEIGATYEFYIKTVIDNGEEKLSADCSQISGKTNLGERAATPQNVKLVQMEDGKIQLTWDEAENAKYYKVLHAVSRFAEYSELQNNIEETQVIVDYEGDRYSQYYKVIAVNTDDEDSNPSEPVSLETQLFGDHTFVFAETDDVTEIDKLLKELFDKQNDFENDAQFNGEQWQVYFKPGDYTKTSCMYLGFYTSFNGLGKTPYEVKLNNIAIPAYLPAGELGGDGNNATCNFWRSAENLSVIDTNNEQGKAGFESWRSNEFNWAVAQAAPLRRVYSTRPVSYDWNFGWASGGYVADCLFEGVTEDGNSAGTSSGQQFFTRNTEMTGNFFGCTLNNFFMGVEAANNLNETTGTPLLGGNGYTNWGKGAAADENGIQGQQIVTDITSTPKISEKPFLYLNNGEYMVFVPAIRTDARGISWSKDNMGAGYSIPLSDFYIAFPTDSAATINAQIAAGKNIYFTPGQYHVEAPIEVNREDTILLGTGMASIIPDNTEMAIKVADLDGIRIAGLVLDAGPYSKYLMKVGEKGQHISHADNPIILQDLFFRVGGTTDKLTKADDALEINSDDVIGDHFWIWRADHGAGVEWYGNESKHGLIVNGDNVTCYALFDEHFQEYNALWNGENGATYFFQNETCYDPISQEAWMSHNNQTQGYSSYKVSNDVKKHYAVGLGVYNVFIYTGPAYNATGVGIELENAIEVPNAPGVIVEDACTQTFANDGDMLQKINHVINGVGGCVSSGHNPVTGEEGTGWSRKYIVSYNNGNAVVGKWDETKKGAFVGLDIIENIPQTTDEVISVDRIEMLYNQYSKLNKSDYTVTSWNNAGLEQALAAAKDMIAEGKLHMKKQDLNQSEISEIQSEINKVCTKLEAAYEKLIEVGHAQAVYDANKNKTKADCTVGEWPTFGSTLERLKKALEAIDTEEPSNKQSIYRLQAEADEACERLELILSLVDDLKKAQDGSIKESNYTAKSWAVYQQAVNDAKKVVAYEKVSMENLNAAAKKLTDAKLVLEMQKPGSTGISGGAIGGGGYSGGSSAGAVSGTVTAPKQEYNVELQNDGSIKLTGTNGKVIINKLVTMDDGTKYYATKNGTVAMNQIVKVNGKKYFAKDDGVIAIDEICQTTKGSKVYAGKNGVLAANKVITVEGLKYYVKADSTIAKNGFYKTAKGTKVYAKASGVLVTGKIFTKNKKMYYADKNGTIVTKKWVKVGDKKYYCSASGKITKTVKISK